MLDTSETNLWRELQNGTAWRDDLLASLEDQINRYTGPYYKGDGNPADEEETDFENHAYEQISAFVPATVAERPRVKVSTRRPVAQRDVAKALQGHVNRWIRDTNFKEVLEQLAVDFMFRWAVAMVSVRPRPESRQSDDPLLTQQVTRISPKNFAWDPMAPDPSQARWLAHRYKLDKDELIEMAKADPDGGWNLEVIESLTPGMANSHQSDAVGSDENEYELDRGQIELWDIYIPEETDHSERGEQFTHENGFTGTLRTLAVSTSNSDLEGEGKEKGFSVREPQPYFGAPGGPYRVGGAYFVPDKGAPLSPLVVTQAQSDNHNAFVGSMVRSLMDYCRKIVATGIDQDDAERINAAKHDHITRVSNPIDVSRDLQVFETGGISQQHVLGEQILRDTYERVSGQSGALKGEVEGGATATAVSEAVDAGQARATWPRNKFITFAEMLLHDVMRYGYYTDQIVEFLGEEAQDLIRPDDPTILPEGMEAIFFGGNFEEGSGATFEDLETTIDLYSMIRTSEASQQRKAALVIQLMQVLPPLMAQFPFVKWREVIDMLGDMENIPELADAFDWKVLEQMSGAPMPAPTTPMTASNAGQMGLNAPGFQGRIPNVQRAQGSLQSLQPSSNGQAPSNGKALNGAAAGGLN